MNIANDFKPLTVYQYKLSSPKIDSYIKYILSVIPNKYEEEFPSFSVFESYSKWGAHYEPNGEGDGTIHCGPSLLSDPRDVAIGTLAHEFAHLFLQHPNKGGLEDEWQADALASKWGFRKEIAEMREQVGPPTIDTTPVGE